MREAPLDDTSDSVARLRQLCLEGTDAIICLTGVGTRALFALAGQLGLEARLREVFEAAIVTVRGPKPTAVLRELGVRIDRTAPEPNTSREVLAVLASDKFSRVAVQLYGGPDPELRQGLQARGATVLELPVYRWALPDDVQPLRDLAADVSRADALAVTSATQIHNLFEVAEAEGQADSLRTGLQGLVVAAVGPVAAAALLEHGIDTTVQPEHSSLGALIRDIARHFANKPS